MTNSRLIALVDEAVRLDREIAARQEQLKELKARLITEARARIDDDPTGHAVTFTGETGDIARVNFPAAALKSSLDGDGKPIEKARAVAGRFFQSLFVPAVSYAPVEGFRTQAEILLGANSPRLIKLCESESKPRVSFETKQATAAS